MDASRILARLAALPAATVYEAAGKQGDMSPRIRPIVPGTRLAGPAYTVRCFPGDATAVIRAIDAAAPGDVIVIDAGGTERATVLGGSSVLAAGQRGLAGFVTNGSVRDVDEIAAFGMPVFAAGISVRGTLKNDPGRRGVTVSVGGVAVSPGDIVLGDSDGIVVVAAAVAEDVCDRAEAQRTAEERRDRRLRDGESLAEVLGLPPED